MYLYDRELMKEHLQGPSSNPDCGHGAFDTNYIDSRMINLDLMAKANIGLTYINAPSGFFNRMVTLFNIKEKRLIIIVKFNISQINMQISILSWKYQIERCNKITRWIIRFIFIITWDWETTFIVME